VVSDYRTNQANDFYFREGRSGTPCPKCGSMTDGWDCRYSGPNQRIAVSSSYFTGTLPDELLWWTCRRCGYERSTPPADATETPS
jgi:hypothetical protein